MSHELRTPLNSTLIPAKLLADNKPGNLSPDQVKYAQTIYAGRATTCWALINDIPDSARSRPARPRSVETGDPVHPPRKR